MNLFMALSVKLKPEFAVIPAVKSGVRLPDNRLKLADADEPFRRMNTFGTDFNINPLGPRQLDTPTDEADFLLWLHRTISMWMQGHLNTSARLKSANGVTA